MTLFLVGFKKVYLVEVGDWITPEVMDGETDNIM